MPIYNGIEFLNQSLNSIKNQTYTNWKLIIGINGHEQNSSVFRSAVNLVNSNNYIQVNNKITIIDFYTLKGKSNTLNEMIKYVESDWISLLDVDDIWLPNKLLAQIPFIDKYDVIGTKCKYFGDSNKIIKLPIGDLKQFNFLNTNPIINSSSLLKTKLANWNQTNDGIEDYELWLKLWKTNYKFYNVNKILVLHRIHNASAFNSKGNNLLVKALKEQFINN